MVMSPDYQDREQARFIETTQGKTAVRITQTATHAEDGVYLFSPLVTGGTDKEMNKDGSVTPVDFTYAPGAGEVWYIETVTLTIEDKGKMDANAFGSIIGGLASGLLISVQSKGTVHDIGTLKDNMDISNVFVGGSTPTSTGWFDTDDAFIGSLDFHESRMVLRGDDNDFFRIRVRDNLTSIDFLRSTILVWRVI